MSGRRHEGLPDGVRSYFADGRLRGSARSRPLERSGRAAETLKWRRLNLECIVINQLQSGRADSPDYARGLPAMEGLCSPSGG